MNDLLALQVTLEAPADMVSRCGRVLAQFDHRTQDSGNVSWLVSTDEGDLFVKTAGTPGPSPVGAPVPRLGLSGRVEVLRNAVALARSCEHKCLPRLRHVVESPLGPLLVYDRSLGELLGTTRSRRDDPTSAYQRFAHLPPRTLFDAFSDLIDLHQILAAAGWLAGDLYDGCLIFDFGSCRLSVVDLDSYHRGPSTNTMGRMFGSTRFMAPEEFELGAVIDQRTTVYTLARLVWHFGTRLSEQDENFCGSDALRAVLGHALELDPAGRFDTVDGFASAWREVRSRSQ